VGRRLDCHKLARPEIFIDEIRKTTVLQLIYPNLHYQIWMYIALYI
jgi:hypothetical protein